MTKLCDNWSEMFRKLTAFQKKHDHCNIPTSFREDPQLGRWVAAQRYKKRVGELSEDKIKKLNGLRFLWSPSEQAWEEMFRLLVAFKKKYGHCNVPTYWPKNPSLANWLQKQRHLKKIWKLSSKRIKQLEEIGFWWSIYKNPKEGTLSIDENLSDEKSESLEERLYSLGNGIYVQYGGKGRKPKGLKDYIASHNGEFPPYVPLPQGETNFYMGERYVREKKIYWKGQGRLPEEVLDYVRENGRLPPHDW